MSSQSSHHPQEVLLAQFCLYVHKGGLNLSPIHFIFERVSRISLGLALALTSFRIRDSTPFDSAPCCFLAHCDRRGGGALVLRVIGPLGHLSYRKISGSNQVKNSFFRISNISVPCPHAQLRSRTVIKKLWTFFGHCGRDRSQSRHVGFFG